MKVPCKRFLVVLLLILLAAALNTSTRVTLRSPRDSSYAAAFPEFPANQIQPAWFNREIPSAYFGMTLIEHEHWPDFPIGSLGKGTEVNWSYVERVKGTFDWSRLDQWVRSAEAHNVDFMFSNDLIPQWAAKDPATCKPTYPGSAVLGCTSMVGNLRDWEIFVTALVTRYKGRIRIYELWNEPDQYFSGSMRDMVTLTSTMLRIIRNIDQSAFVLSPSATTADFMDHYWESGGPTTADAVAIHGYPTEANPEPEGIIEIAADYRKVMAKYGLQRLPLWDSEGSWGDSSRRLVSSRSQAAFTARHLLLHWSAGIERFYWYAWDNDGWGTLWTANNGLTSSGSTYRRVMGWMAGAVMTSPCRVSSDSTWECTLMRSNGSNTLVVWNSSTNKIYQPPAQYQECNDLDGRLRLVTGPVTIGKEPVLFRTEKTAPRAASTGAP